MAAGLGVDHPSSSTAEITNALELYLRAPSVPALAWHEVNFILYVH